MNPALTTELIGHKESDPLHWFMLARLHLQRKMEFFRRLQSYGKDVVKRM